MAQTPATLPALLNRALSGRVAVSDHRTDQRIIDAVLEELLTTPLHKLSLEDVARRAGLTRMTIYRRFGDRQHLIEAAFSREVSGFLDGIVAADDPTAPPVERIAEAFATGLRLAHGHPLVGHLTATNPGGLLEALLADDAFVIKAGGAFIAARIDEGSETGTTSEAARQTGELLVRLFAALVLMPPTSVDLADPDQARELARHAIAPIVVRGS